MALQSAFRRTSYLALRPVFYSASRSLTAEQFYKYKATNEPMPDYAPGSEARQRFLDTLEKYKDAGPEDIPIVVGDREIRSGSTRHQVSPFDHGKRIAEFRYADAGTIDQAISECLRARVAWEATPYEQRADVFLRAADLFANKYRMDLLATTMLGQAKTVWQAEIDAAAELIDFFRFNVQYAAELLQQQPLSGATRNYTRYRGMEGFWAAISPFNFTAIGGHLGTAPALMGNVAVWKPSDTAILSNYLVFKILREAGLPSGVINFVPADGPTFGRVVTSHPDLAGINFTGSVATFRWLWKEVGKNIDVFKSYPRMIGECGGKNYHFVHASADVASVVNNTVRSAFEYGGQKCSACSRLVVPHSLSEKIKSGLVEAMKHIKLGPATELDSFLSAVIDDKAVSRVRRYLELTNSSPDLSLVHGGTVDDSTGYFVEPTLIEAQNIENPIMTEEIFAPVLTMYSYPDDAWRETLDQVNNATPFALTGAIFAGEQSVLDEMAEKMTDSAGNFYINTKSTGSVVGNQPFGGGRLSGTNDKAGGPHYLLRFTSPQSVSVATSPLEKWSYPSMQG